MHNRIYPLGDLLTGHPVVLRVCKLGWPEPEEGCVVYPSQQANRRLVKFLFGPSQLLVLTQYSLHARQYESSIV